MQRDMDCIQFESRQEIEEIMTVIDKYVMHMEW